MARAARRSHVARLTALAGIVMGLGLSPLTHGPPPLEASLAAAAIALGVVLARPRGAGPLRHCLWLGILAAAFAAPALCAGAARLAAIDAGALRAAPGQWVSVRGFVEAVPRRAAGEVRVRVATADGRLLLSAPEPVGELRVGHEVAATGVLREPQPWEEEYLRRLGIAQVAQVRRIAPTGRRRGGLPYFTDRLRERAEEALTRGTPEAQSALLRGFVLGEDDRIDPATVSDFQRSGLAHLLAVSGQNVLLLALLAGPVLALLGVPVRARLGCILVLIGLYVPMAGAGPSIQRAGVMGAAATIATLAGRPTARWYALLLAAAVTLALNPRAAGDVGWQLSFAAVIGIALWAPNLRERLAGPRNSPTRTALAEAAAITVAATVATAPLMAHHFERLSVAALAANLVALPAVAPVMWLGMLAAAVGQLPWIPVEPLTGLAGLMAAYVAAVGHWLASPAWAEVPISLSDPWALVAVYSLLAVAAWLTARRAERRRALEGRLRRPLLLAAASILVLLGAARLFAGESEGRQPSLRISVLDVGQGDAILLDPARGEPILVDAGPPNTAAADALRALGVERLAALVVTHDDSDHSGGLAELLGAVPARTLAYGARAPSLRRAAAAAGARSERVAAGSTIASGGLRLDVLWPPRELLGSPAPDEPNTRSVVMLARYRHFEMLLTGDGEAEAVPLDPGPLDVLKVAHHGSEDAGLQELLERTGPQLAVISVGAENPYGHPAPATLAELHEQGVPVVRTDEAGSIEIAVTARHWSVASVG